MIPILAALVLAATPAATPKNVILLIADGTGPAHMTVAANVRGAEFRIGKMPVVGLMSTWCADRAVTDSAAGATALATGAKAKYEALSIDPTTGAPLTTVLETAEKRGKATGLVTTGSFWDATPAAFAAHVKHRRESMNIIRQMLASGVDLIAGGGAEKFGKEDFPPLADLAKQTKYTAITTRAQLDASKGGSLLAVFPKHERDLDAAEASLPVLAAWALDHLDDDPDGFFLMIEHEGTDTTSHQNIGPDLRLALASFDEAVGVALDFARKRGDTLVVVTADHETGGLRISQTEAKRFRMEWSTTDHTGTVVHVFAYGPGAPAFAGFQDNTDVGKKLRAAVGN